MKLVQKQNFEPKIKPMIVNLQNELYQLKKNRKKVLNFVLTLGRSWRAKKAPKRSSEYVKDKICKCKKYLKYILMIKKSKYSMDILKSAKKKKQLLLLNFLPKILT